MFHLPFQGNLEKPSQIVGNWRGKRDWHFNVGCGRGNFCLHSVGMSFTTIKGGNCVLTTSLCCASVSRWCCHELSQFQVLSDYFADNEQLCRWEHRPGFRRAATKHRWSMFARGATCLEVGAGTGVIISGF